MSRLLAHISRRDLLKRAGAASAAAAAPSAVTGRARATTKGRGFAQELGAGLDEIRGAARSVVVRRRNQSAYGNVIFAVTPEIETSFEYRWLATTPRGAEAMCQIPECRECSAAAPPC